MKPIEQPNIIDIPLFKLQRDVINDHIHGKESNLDISVYNALLGIENLLDLIYDRLIDYNSITLTVADKGTKNV